jgi:hypothetical protein
MGRKVMVSRILTTHDEAEAFHWLGASVVSLWSTLPFDIQEALVERALEMSRGDIDAADQIKVFTNQRNGNGNAPRP